MYLPKIKVYFILEFTWQCHRQPISILHYPISRLNQYISILKLSAEKKRKMDLLIWVSGQREIAPPLIFWFSSSNEYLDLRLLPQYGYNWKSWEMMVICSVFWSWYLTWETCLVAWFFFRGGIRSLIGSQTEHEQARCARRKPHLLATLVSLLTVHPPTPSTCYSPNPCPSEQV